MTGTPAPALTAAEQDVVDRFGIFEPEEREAALVETVARALWDVDNPHYPAVFTKAQADELWARSRGYPMHTTYVTRAAAAIAAYRNAQDAAEGYHVELGGQRFTQAQWEAVLVWRTGTDIPGDDAASWSPRAQDCGAEEAVRRVEALLDDAEARYERTSFRYFDGSKPRAAVDVSAVRTALATQAGDGAR